MSVPPQIIHIKRKRGAEDPPLPYLRIEQSMKRHRSGAFAYQRRDDETVGPGGATYSPSRDTVPIIHASKPGDEFKSPRVLRKEAAPAAAAAQKKAASSGKEIPKDSESSTPKPSTTSSPKEPRRFHMARPKAQAPLSYSSGVSKRSRVLSGALFVERTKRKKLAAKVDQQLNANDMELDDASPHRLKPPSAVKRQPSGLPLSQQKDNVKSRLPAYRWDEDMDQLAREMNAYTLEQIGRNIAMIDATTPVEVTQSTTAPRTPAVSSRKLKFKPKAPAQRWAERNPTEAAILARAAATTMANEVDEDEDEDEDDDDSLIETYERIPENILGGDIPAHEIGLLVFDTDFDVEFFYDDESESGEEFLDDEDENAENYYTADYPDDEMEEDDEFDRDPYMYRTGNASHLEEFDENEFDENEYNGDDGEINAEEFKSFVSRAPLAQ